jgi:hypothetical protein
MRTEYAQYEELAFAQARMNTFTTELPEGSIGAHMTSAIASQPWLRFFVPFIRTPANLIKFTTERTPGLALASRRYKDLAKAANAAGATPLAKAEFKAAKARMWIGTGIMAGIGMAAYQGKITGSGPGNSQEMAALRSTGWKPNSIVFDNDDGTKEYISYDRLDPIGFIIGIATAFGEAYGSMEYGDVEAAASGILFGLSDILKSKNYVTGLTKVLDAINNPDEGGKAYIQNVLGSFVPNYVASFNRTGVIGDIGPFPGIPPDHQLRQMEGWLDGIRSKIPGLSADLPPRRNIFGEIISYDMGVGPDSVSPFQSRVAADTLVNREIQRLVLQHGFGMNMNSFKTIEGVELTPDQRDAYIVMITGDPHRNGSDFRADLEKLFQSDAYRDADDGKFGKQKMIHDIFRKRSARARKLMKRKNPDLRIVILEARRLRKRAQKLKIAKSDESATRENNVTTLLTDLTAPVDTLT